MVVANYLLSMCNGLSRRSRWVFSLNFSSAGKGRFMAGKAQDMCQRHTLMGGRGVVEWGTLLGPCCEILELSPLKGHSLNILSKLAILFFIQQFKMFDSNNFTPSSMRSFQNVWPIKRKAVYTLVIFHIFIHLLVRIGSDHNSLAYILTLLFKF